MTDIRKGNLYYPYSAIHSQGTLLPAIEKIEENLRSVQLKPQSTTSRIARSLQLIDLYSWKEDWEKVAEIASQGLETGCGPHAAVRLYRAWVEALRSVHDVEGLQSLALHLLKMRQEKIEFLGIALQALIHAGRASYSRVIYEHLRHGKHKNVVIVESLAVYMAENLSKPVRRKGVQILKALCLKEKSGYFTLKNYLSYALSSELMEDAATAYRLLSERFPESPEPYWGAALLAAGEGQWGEAALALQELLSDNPDNADAIGALALCFEMTGDLLAARDLLQANAFLFAPEDYDFNVAMGMINKKLFTRYGVNSYKQASLWNLKKALHAARSFRISEAPLHLALHELTDHTPLTSFEKTPLGEDSLSEPQFWALSLDDELLRGVLRQTSFLIRAPRQVSVGDVMFLMRGGTSFDGTHQQFIGLFRVCSNGFPDSNLGNVVCLSDSRVFPKTISLTLLSSEILGSPEQDVLGLNNFSSTGSAFYFKLDRDGALQIIEAVERYSVDLSNEVRESYAV